MAGWEWEWEWVWWRR